MTRLAIEARLNQLELADRFTRRRRWQPARIRLRPPKILSRSPACSRMEKTVQAIDWDEPVDLHRRERSDNDGALEIVPLASGTLSEMVGYVFLLPAGDRATVLIEGHSIGILGVFEIIALSMRPDFPVQRS
jgi:hypothetical protein